MVNVLQHMPDNDGFERRLPCEYSQDSLIHRSISLDPFACFCNGDLLAERRTVRDQLSERMVQAITAYCNAAISVYGQEGYPDLETAVDPVLFLNLISTVSADEDHNPFSLQQLGDELSVIPMHLEMISNFPGMNHLFLGQDRLGAFSRMRIPQRNWVASLLTAAALRVSNPKDQDQFLHRFIATAAATDPEFESAYQAVMGQMTHHGKSFMNQRCYEQMKPILQALARTWFPEGFSAQEIHTLLTFVQPAMRRLRP